MKFKVEIDLDKFPHEEGELWHEVREVLVNVGGAVKSVGYDGDKAVPYDGEEAVLDDGVTCGCYATCAWCGEEFPVSEMVRERDLGLVCETCKAAICSRGEEFVEGER